MDSQKKKRKIGLTLQWNQLRPLELPLSLFSKVLKETIKMWQNGEKKKGKLRESSLHIQGDFLKKLVILAQKQKTKKKTTVGNGDKKS